MGPQSEIDRYKRVFGVGDLDPRKKSHRLTHTRKGRWVFATVPSALCFPQVQGITAVGLAAVVQ